MIARPNAERATLLAGVLLPGVVILAARFVGAGPASASAADATGPPPELPVLATGAANLAPDQRRALDAAERLARDASVPSPFEPAAVAADAAKGGSATARSGPISANVRVTAIYSDPERLIVVVDGEQRRLGEEVAPGWTLDAVDSRSQRVRIRHASGATEIHRVHRFD